VARDDKIITAWNGLMIGALARGGAILHRDDYIRAAEKAATFVLQQMRSPNGELLRIYRMGHASIPGYLEDYAYLANGLLALHEATGSDQWLDAARTLCDQQIRLFWDEESKGFYFTSPVHQALIARTRNALDGALPSSNAVSVRNLVRLANVTRDEHYRKLARQTLDAFAPELGKAPLSTSYLALALEEYLEGPESRSGELPTDPVAVVQEEPIKQTAAQATASRDGIRNRDAVVSAKAYLSVDKLPAGSTCRIVVFVKIKEGWHIHSNAVSEEWQVPTELVIQSKLGTALGATAYPKGQLVRVAGSERPLAVYEREAVIRGVMRVPEEAAGKREDLRIIVKYQACDAHGCQPPTSVKLRGEVPVAGPGESPREINQNLFSRRGG
jgi:uncharacterized protein